MKKIWIYLIIFVSVLLLWGIDMIFYENKPFFQTQIKPQKSSYQHIKQGNILKVGIIPNSVSYFQIDKKTAGLEYELVRNFANYLGVDTNIQLFSNQEELLKSLQRNEIDIGVANLLPNTVLPPLNYLLGPAYYSASWQFVYRKGNRIPKDLNDLCAKVLISKDSSLNYLLHHLNSTYPNLHWEMTDKTEEALLIDVAEGKIPYTIANSVLIASTQNTYPHIAVGFDIADKSGVHWYLSPTLDTTLQSKLLAFMHIAMEQGITARLEEKYITHLKSFDYVDNRTYINAIQHTLPKYQAWFEKYQGNVNWQLLASISYQESHWDPLATSPTGVRGMMMLTKATAEYVGVKNRLDPEQSIRGGASYLHFLLQNIPTTVREEERIWYALVAYNMGLRHLFDALQLTKQLGDNPDNWLDVKKNLPLLSQSAYYKKLKHGYAQGVQAFQYVENIRRYLHIMNHYFRHQASSMTSLAEDNLKEMEKLQNNGIEQPIVLPLTQQETK